MKKTLIIVAVIAVIAIFTFPAPLFADEGDAEDYVGVRESENHGGVYAGQYVLGYSDDTTTDSEGDGDTEVLCIDGDEYVDQSANAYTLTDTDVSDELEGEVTGSDTITETEAVAVEILSKEATGASSVEDQVAVWQETGDRSVSTYNSLSPDQKNNVDSINASVEALAQNYIDNGGDLTLDEFLDNEDVNEIDITIEQDEDIFNGVNGTATATMKNPLVPGITDKGKSVYWYILEGAFNISFSKDSLVTETSSESPAAGTNPTEMNDIDDDSDDITDPNDNDYAESKEDNIGSATVDYYYFWWGLNEYPEGTMGVNLFAWVDIDEDNKFDIVDVDSEKAADGEDSDGDVVENFQSNNKVVKVDDNGTPDTSDDEVKTDGNGNVVAEEIPESDMDIHKVEGGKVVIADEDLVEVRGSNENQRFSTLSYNEPFDDDPEFFGTLIFKMSGNEEPLEGAIFGIYNNPDASGDPVETVITGKEGYASTSGLLWGTYYIKEISAPSGYKKDSTIYTVEVGGNGTSVTIGEQYEGVIPFKVINEPQPPDRPDESEEPDKPDKPGGSVQVLGIQELPFTGMHPAIPISGISSILIGGFMVVASFIRKKFGRK